MRVAAPAACRPSDAATPFMCFLEARRAASSPEAHAARSAQKRSLRVQILSLLAKLAQAFCRVACGPRDTHPRCPCPIGQFADPPAMSDNEGDGIRIQKRWAGVNRRGVSFETVRF
jgi:hypothetical protein